ncbi:sulfurtransferase complex subunit TusC [Rheinheimera maricola]|uniref:Sulfurtransferase complex subunit TusC n=1 Tax=Rheinheimera maricola TaxID=2793282 RepID=A0ABS7X582_9GAMM|nr:sulfurtransferase complex subunit TusC [Rheinheimera maricola]MBZ9610705.1 sulfurtransferase complex subunit TusC [Rheinheimera maricola]
MRNILVIQQHSPFNSSKGREALDLILAMAAVEHNVSVLFSGDAVYQLLSSQDHVDFKLKAYPRSFKLFALYDIEHVYVCQHALQQRGIEAHDISIRAKVLDKTDIALLLARQHQVITS